MITYPSTYHVYPVGTVIDICEVSSQTRNFFGRFHSFDDKPSRVQVFKGGNIRYEWHFDGFLDRVDKPAVIEIDRHGILCRKIWYENGRMYMEADTGARKISKRRVAKHHDVVLKHWPHIVALGSRVK